MCVTTDCSAKIAIIDAAREEKADMFEMTDILTLRSGVDTYGWFVSQFLPAVVGSRCWNANYRKNTISSFVTVSDEAFALVNMENNYARWQDMFIKQNTKTSEVGALWTNSGES